jgi:glycosyltransferase involved in cell wall biosynthesis
MRVLFVTNFCPHYRVRTFELLARRVGVEFVFFSRGEEWYWEPRHGLRTGNFSWREAKGVALWRLVSQADVDVILKDIDGVTPLILTFLAAKLRRKPFVLWTGMWRHPSTLFHLLTYPLTKLLYCWSDAIVVYGDHVKRYLASIGVRPEKVLVAPHAVDNLTYGRSVSEGERCALRARFGLGDRPVVLYVGRIEASKGPDVLLHAFHRVPGDAVLAFVGAGTLQTELQRRVAGLGLKDRVLFAGYQNPEDTVAWYAVADVLVLPSVAERRGSEPWGLVVNEAMNQGTPVVASTAVGAAAGGLVQPSRNGAIVPERDAGALALELTRLLGDAELRHRLGVGARATIAAWNNERMVDGFVAAFEYAQAHGKSAHRE